MRINLILLFFLTFCFNSISAQTVKEPLQLDDIQVDVKSAVHNVKTDSVVIELFLLPLGKNPREFKLNVFATQVLDSKATTNFITTIKMGRVLINLADRQNYLHYLFQPDTPALIKVMVANWSKSNTSKPHQVKLVFEDSKETGKFNELFVAL